MCIRGSFLSFLWYYDNCRTGLVMMTTKASNGIIIVMIRVYAGKFAHVPSTPESRRLQILAPLRCSFEVAVPMDLQDEGVGDSYRTEI